MIRVVLPELMATYLEDSRNRTVSDLEGFSCYKSRLYIVLLEGEFSR